MAENELAGHLSAGAEGFLLINSRLEYKRYENTKASRQSHLTFELVTA